MATTSTDGSAATHRYGRPQRSPFRSFRPGRGWSSRRRIRFLPHGKVSRDPLPAPPFTAVVVLCSGLAACSSSNAGTSGPTYSNPVFRHDAPDPSIIRAANGNFYIYTTQSIYSAGVLNLPILKSSDLVHWKLAGEVFHSIPRWAVGGPGGDMWAPHGFYYRGKYYVYYAARQYGTGIMAIGVATSDSPTGPFKDLGHPLRKWEKKNYVAIDPFVFQAKNGHLYLYWGSNSDPIQRATAHAGRSPSGG